VKKIYALGFAALAALPLAGCYTPEERAVGGALLGGATGAVIGAAATGRGSGAAAGAAIGAASGAIIGANTRPAYADPYYYPAPPPPPRVYAAPVYGAPVYAGPRVYAAPAPRCWVERQPVLDAWGRVVAYQRVRVCG
jgi:osmotically inducible lipoprotein OsmB